MRLSFVLILLNALALFSMTPGETSLSFLKIPLGARPAALGSAYTALGDDAAAMFYNPSLTGLISENEVSAMHMEYFEGLRYENIMSAFKIRDFYVIGFGAGYFYTPGIPKTVSADNLDGFAESGVFYSADMLFVVNNAFKLSETAGIGVNLKYIGEFIDHQSVSTFAADIGYYSDILFVKNLRIGLSVLNLGLPVQYLQAKEVLAVVLKAGTVWSFRHLLRIGLDFEKPADKGLTVHAAAEGIILENYFIRTGYHLDLSQNSTSGFSAGLGAVYHEFIFNYAFVPYKFLGLTHRFELGVQF